MVAFKCGGNARFERGEISSFLVCQIAFDFEGYQENMTIIHS